MKRLGEVRRVAQGLAVVRTVAEGESSPSIGAAVTTANLEGAGRIVDVFGPVGQPYVAVTPDDGVALTDLLGDPLYVED